MYSNRSFQNNVFELSPLFVSKIVLKSIQIRACPIYSTLLYLRQFSTRFNLNQ
eukprot:UN22139